MTLDINLNLVKSLENDIKRIEKQLQIKNNKKKEIELKLYNYYFQELLTLLDSKIKNNIDFKYYNKKLYYKSYFYEYWYYGNKEKKISKYFIFYGIEVCINWREKSYYNDEVGWHVYYNVLHSVSTDYDRSTTSIKDLNYKQMIDLINFLNKQ